MRASEIRNLLIQKYGYGAEAIARILDKNELKQLLLTEMVKAQNKDKFESYKSVMYNVLYVLAGIFLFALALRPIISYIRELRTSKDKGMNKIKLVLKHYRKGYVLGSVTLFLSVILDVISSGMTLSTFASWVIPYDSPFRRLLIPMLSFPLNSSMISSIASGRTEGTRGGYGIDIGPMLTIGLVNWLIHQLQEWSSLLVLKGMKEKETRKAQKKALQSEPSEPARAAPKSRKQVKEKDVDVASAFTKSMRASRAQGFTDENDPYQEEFDLFKQTRSMSEPPMHSHADQAETSVSNDEDPSASQQHAASTLSTDFDEVRRLNQHFARMHSREVNNDTVHYTREDRVDICILDRLASICEETTEDVVKETTVTPVVDGISDEGGGGGASLLNVGGKESPVYSPLSMTREQSAAMLANLQNVDYYNQEEEETGGSPDSKGEEVLSPGSRDVRSSVSEDSDDDTYREAVAVSGDSHDPKHEED